MRVKRVILVKLSHDLVMDTPLLGFCLSPIDLSLLTLGDLGGRLSHTRKPGENSPGADSRTKNLEEVEKDPKCAAVTGKVGSQDKQARSDSQAVQNSCVKYRPVIFPIAGQDLKPGDRKKKMKTRLPISASRSGFIMISFLVVT